MPIPTKNKSYNGMKGKAEVRVLADTIKVNFQADGDTYVVNKNGWDRPSGIYNITLGKNNDEIKFTAPVGRDEPYLVKFLEYANRVGRSEGNPGVPEPKIKNGLHGKEAGLFVPSGTMANQVAIKTHICPGTKSSSTATPTSSTTSARPPP